MECSKCNLNENQILCKCKFWTFVFHKQDYLGRCVIVTNRHVDNFSKLKDEEIIEMRNILGLYEKILYDLYGCTLLNWCCNMNNSYSDSKSNPHVHIHIRPRYKNKVKVLSTVYEDKEFGAHYDRNAPIQFDEKTINYIFEQIKSSMANYIYKK